jgi:hypothetical protein
MKFNPNGESGGEAAFMAADKTHRTGGLIARVYTADPAEPAQM